MKAAALACALLLGLAGCRSTPEGRPLDGLEMRRELRALPSVSAGTEPPRALEGSVVLVSFFATWCFPCVAELPTLIALQRDFGPQGFLVVGVGMDLEGMQVLEPFARTMELPYPVLMADEAVRDGQSAFGPVRALPTSFLLDRDGRLIGAWQGMAPHGALSEAIQKALAR
ncbi:TlpA disulfide reductase family protein [Myxococcaceae bacterium GXIMD 01537]